MRCLRIGTLLLAVGTVTGAIWADYSWGRFWGWDPKEVWALITLLGYLACCTLAARSLGGPFWLGLALGDLFLVGGDRLVRSQFRARIGAAQLRQRRWRKGICFHFVLCSVPLCGHRGSTKCWPRASNMKTRLNSVVSAASCRLHLITTADSNSAAIGGSHFCLPCRFAWGATPRGASHVERLPPRTHQ